MEPLTVRWIFDFVCVLTFVFSRRERHLHSKRELSIHSELKRICIGLSIHLLDPLLIRVAAAPLPSGGAGLPETADETPTGSRTGGFGGAGPVYCYSWSQPALSFARRRYRGQRENHLLAAFASIPSAFKERENNNVAASAVDSSVAALRWVARFFSIVGREGSLARCPVGVVFLSQEKKRRE